MKPIIGIITRPIFSEENNKMFGIYEDMKNAIYYNGGLPIGIMPSLENIEEVIAICDGIIFQGGDFFTDYEKKCMIYAYDNNIPTLAICLGMQLMGITFGATEYEIKNHKEKDLYVHKILIDENSKLFSILKEKEIYVNSRHKTAIKNPKIDIVAKSEDNVIEAIEDKNKRFFIGLEWHPESMLEYDESSKKIFQHFINVCKN